MSKLPRNTLPRTSRLGSDVIFEGRVSFTTALTVSGRLKGTVESEVGTLRLEESARLDARVVVHTVSARGQIYGDIVCLQRCSLEDGAVVRGVVIASTVEIAPGVSFDGEVNMFSQLDDIKLMELTPAEAHQKICEQALCIHDEEVRQRFGISAAHPVASPAQQSPARLRRKRKLVPSA